MTHFDDVPPTITEVTVPDQAWYGDVKCPVCGRGFERRERVLCYTQGVAPYTTHRHCRCRDGVLCYTTLGVLVEVQRDRDRREWERFARVTASLAGDAQAGVDVRVND